MLRQQTQDRTRHGADQYRRDPISGRHADQRTERNPADFRPAWIAQKAGTPQRKTAPLACGLTEWRLLDFLGPQSNSVAPVVQTVGIAAFPELAHSDFKIIFLSGMSHANRYQSAFD